MASGDVEEAIGPSPGQYMEPGDHATTLEEATRRGQHAASPDHTMEPDEDPVADDSAGHVWRVQVDGPSAVLEGLDPNGASSTRMRRAACR